MNEIKKSMKRNKQGTHALYNTVPKVAFLWIKSDIRGCSSMIIFSLGMLFYINFILKNIGNENAIAVSNVIVILKYRIVESKYWSSRSKVNNDSSLIGRTMIKLKEYPYNNRPRYFGPNIPPIAARYELINPQHIPIRLHPMIDKIHET